MLSAASSSVPLGSGPSPSLCSTPGLLPMMHYMPSAAPMVNPLCELQLQPPMANAYEGIPIFIVPQNGVGPSAVSIAALQRATASLQSAPQEPKIDTSKHYHVFVGDLSPEVENRQMKEAFAVHGEVSEAKVIRDAQTQKSKGYGFVSFPNKDDAEKAIAAMNGQWLGRRAIRTNWATRRPADEAREKLTFEQVFNSTKPDNTSVYVGNISQSTTENDLREPFAAHGDITEVRLFKSQGYAFVRYEKKENATTAIMEMNGKMVGGNSIRCSWGRVQQSSSTTQIMPDLAPLLSQSLMPTQLPIPNMYFNPYFPQVYNPVVPQWQA